MGKGEDDGSTLSHSTILPTEIIEHFKTSRRDFGPRRGNAYVARACPAHISQYVSQAGTVQVATPKAGTRCACADDRYDGVPD